MADRIERALVTGASSGLGERFARHLAARGVDLVLVARDERRLTALAGELPVDAEVVVADLADPVQRTAVEARLGDDRERPVDLLVNNAGSGGFGTVAELSADQHQAIIDVNALALVRLTRAVLPQLLRRRTGGIIQVGSITAFQPDPFSATYGATKAFVRSFTEALQIELAGSAVHVMLLSPGSTRTRFHERAGADHERLPRAVQVDADEIARQALVAFALKRRSCTPGVVTRALIAGSRLAPSRIAARVSGLAHRRLAEGPEPVSETRGSGGGGPVVGLEGPEPVSETRGSGGGGPVVGLEGPEPVSETRT